MRAVMVAMVGLLAMASAVAAARQDGQVLNDRELAAEMRLNDKVARYIDRNGYPDVAERLALSDERPWDKYQVTLYYLDARKAISFARAWILGAPTIQLEKSELGISPDELARLEPLARTYGPEDGHGDGTAARAEAAAERAEAAAARVDRAAEVAERAADRAEAIVAKMAAAAPRPRRR